MKVRVYFNLHKQKLSVQQKVNGVWKVVRHTNQIVLENVRFIVSEKGRQRVIKNTRKNVHAWIEGEEIDWSNYLNKQFKKATYNPYVSGSFRVRHNDKPITGATFAAVIGKSVEVRHEF
jgi:hypothetical protein